MKQYVKKKSTVVDEGTKAAGYLANGTAYNMERRQERKKKTGG